MSHERTWTAVPPLVTGGASGIGAACARELAGRGAHVTVADVDEVAAKSLADEIGGKAWAVDLLDVAALEDLKLDADILVNNAGIQSINPIEDFRPDKFRAMLALMVEAPFLLIRAALPHMYEQRIRPDHQHLVGARSAGIASSRSPTSPPSTAWKGCRR